MSAKATATTTIMTLIFGVFVGMLGISFLAYYGGFISWDAAGDARAKTASETPGMDMLEAYKCHRVETKHIIIGGKEDGFSKEGDEAVAANEAQTYRFKKSSNATVFRDYDEGGFDKQLVDKFNIPSKTAHGILVTRVRQISSLKNDHVSIGDLTADYEKGNYGGVTVAGPVEGYKWRFDGELISVNLQDAVFPSRVNRPRDYDDLLAYIRGAQTTERATTPVYISIADDTIVDFIGFAVCEQPAENKGLTFTSIESLAPENGVALSCFDENNIACNAYAGDMLCSAELPIACFKDGMAPMPNFPDPMFERHWSGGMTKLTPPIRGDAFTNADDVHEYCAGLFGEDWRAGSIHDSVNNYIISLGDPIPTGTKTWVDVKGERYGNCWAHRPDYEDLKTEDLK